MTHGTVLQFPLIISFAVWIWKNPIYKKAA